MLSRPQLASPMCLSAETEDDELEPKCCRRSGLQDIKADVMRFRGLAVSYFGQYQGYRNPRRNGKTFG